jgi:hypothetical protein
MNNFPEFHRSSYYSGFSSSYQLLCALIILYIEVLPSFRARKTRAQREQRPKETIVETPITQVSSLRIVKYESEHMGHTASFKQVEQEWSTDYLTEHWRIMREEAERADDEDSTPLQRT